MVESVRRKSLGPADLTNEQETEDHQGGERCVARSARESASGAASSEGDGCDHDASEDDQRKAEHAAARRGSVTEHAAHLRRRFRSPAVKPTKMSKIVEMTAGTADARIVTK